MFKSESRISLDSCALICLSAFVLGSGCVTPKKGIPGKPYPESVKLAPVESKDPVRLQLKGKNGRVEQVSYLHRSISRSYNGNEIHKSLEEIVEFTARSETLKAQNDGTLTQVVSVTRKDGTANLHHFAMPELNEKLEITSTPSGRILKSGNYPKSSLFFVPTISLPEKPVKIGDTWPMQANWVSIEEGIPFSLDMISILKGVYQCGKDQCADIEISGDVSLGNNLLRNAEKPAEFKSEWRGRILFAIGGGTVIWSKVNSDEKFITDPVSRHVRSCLESVLQQPADEKLEPLTGPTCEDFVAKIVN